MKTITLEDKFNDVVADHTTIGEHAPTLRKYAEQCRHVTEVGVEALGSTWAFLVAKPKKLVSIDVRHPSECGGDFELAVNLAKDAGVDFEFRKVDIRETTIEPTELLFIDTWHVYEQLKRELELHASKALKFIILHDTETYGEKGSSPGYVGLNKAIDEFLASDEGSKWKVIEVFKNMHGLTILGKK